LNYWEDKFTFSKERTLEYFSAVRSGKAEAMQNTNTEIEVLDPENVSTTNLDKNALELVKNNPDINFYIFFPPYSILYFVDLYEKDINLFKAEFKLKEELMCNMVEYDNAKVFDFQHLDSITHNLDNYKDLSHFSSSTNKFIIDSLKVGEVELNQDSCTSTLGIIKEQVESFDFSKI